MTTGVLVFGVVLILAGTCYLVAFPGTRRSILRLTVVLSFFDVLQFHAAGVSLRVYQPLTVMVALANLPAVVSELKGTRLGRALTVYTIFTALTLTWTISRSDTASVVVGQIYLLSLFGCFAAELRLRRITISDVVKWIAWGASLSSIAAVLEFMASYAGSRIQIFNVLGIPWHRPAGLMSEPDWAALVAGLGGVAVYYGMRDGFLRRALLWTNLVTIVLCGVRAVWLSTMILVVILSFGQPKVRRAARRLIPLLLVALFLTVGYATYRPSSLSRLDPSAVLSGTGAGDAGSTHSRLGVVRLIVDNVGPVIVQGYGAGTLNSTTQAPQIEQMYGGGGALNTGHGSTNLFLTTLWDSGVVGVITLVIVVVRWFRIALRLSNRLPALLWMSGLMLLDFQVNNGFRFAFVWIALGCYASSEQGAVLPRGDVLSLETPMNGSGR